MTITTVSGIVVLTADAGKYLTNGETYSTKVYLGKNADRSDWTEVSEVYVDDDEPGITAEEALEIILGEVDV